MIELVDDCLRFTFPKLHKKAQLELEFERTLRIPDDNRSHPLPPGLGLFPLHHVDDFSERLPPEWREHGGVFFPMYQAEALWMCFRAGSFADYPMAVKVAAGKVNALTGEPFHEALRERPQDYLVVPAQPWLDGFCVRKGQIRQFVAMPLGEGYTAEEQLTGAARHGGLQIVVYPMKPERYRALGLDDASRWGDGDGLCALSGPAEPGMGLAPGGLMRQEIYEDEFGFDVWEQEVRSRCFVHLLNCAQYREVTGAAPPHEPPTAAEYTDAGLPWFEYYDADRAALQGAERLAQLDSVAARRVQEGKEPPPDDPGATPQPEQIHQVGPTRRTVRDGGGW